MQTKLIPLLVLSLSFCLTFCKKETVACESSDSKECRHEEPAGQVACAGSDNCRSDEPGSMKACEDGRCREEKTEPVRP